MTMGVSKKILVGGGWVGSEAVVDCRPEFLAQLKNILQKASL